MDNKEENYLMLSGIQHFKFCKRQWALIHVEQQWKENVKTVEGKIIHEKVDNPFIKEKRLDKLIIRSMPIKSHALKISGVCDVVEFIKNKEGIELSGLEGKYLPYPVEYKRGKPKRSNEDLLQLTAQVICLEEMLVCRIDKGYMFYHEVRSRLEIPITESLRQSVKEIVNEMHAYFNRNYTPRVKTGSHCRSCSLHEICLPTLLKRQSVKSYIDRMIKE